MPDDIFPCIRCVPLTCKQQLTLVGPCCEVATITSLVRIETSELVTLQLVRRQTIVRRLVDVIAAEAAGRPALAAVVLESR